MVLFILHKSQLGSGFLRGFGFLILSCFLVQERIFSLWFITGIITSQQPGEGKAQPASMMVYFDSWKYWQVSQLVGVFCIGASEDTGKVSSDWGWAWESFFRGDAASWKHSCIVLALNTWTEIKVSFKVIGVGHLCFAKEGTSMWCFNFH